MPEIVFDTPVCMRIVLLDLLRLLTGTRFSAATCWRSWIGLKRNRFTHD